MAPKKPKKKARKKYQIELTSQSLFLWGFGFFFLLTWIFVLGILVGRGFLPDDIMPLTGLKNQVKKLQGIVSHNRDSDMGSTEEPDPDPKLAFYEKLSSKKDEAKKNWVPDDEKRSLENERDQKKPEAASESTSDRNNNKQHLKIENTIKDSESSDYFTVQLASLEEQDKAKRMADRLIAQGYPAYFYEVVVKGRPYYRVRCGKFKNRQEAQAYAEKLAKERGLNGFVSRLE